MFNVLTFDFKTFDFSLSGPIDEDRLAEAGGRRVHPPVSRGFDRTEGEDDAGDDGDGAGHEERKSLPQRRGGRRGTRRA